MRRIGNIVASSVVLILVNFAPLIGVIQFRWNIFEVISLYWMENVIIGLFNIVKMAVSQPSDLASDPERAVEPVLYHLSKLFLIPFFILHYGLFTYGHGVFVLIIFGPGKSAMQAPGMMLQTYSQLLGSLGISFKLTILALLASHLISFLGNFIGKGEYRLKDTGSLLTLPYSRVVVLHLTLLIGGIAVKMLGGPIHAIIVLIVVKTFFDLMLHIKEHSVKIGAPAADSPA